MAAEIRLAEELFIGNVADVRNDIRYAMQGNREVVLDLSGVERVDSAGIQLLLSARKEAEALGVTLVFRESRVVRDLANSIGAPL